MVLSGILKRFIEHMPIQPIKIPQNVYIEDHIVGPLTLKQMLIVGIGAGFSYALYGMLTKAYGALPLPMTIIVWIPAAIAGMFAFVRINDISLFRLLLLTIEKINKPSTRVWSPRRGITINIRTFVAPEDTKQRTEAKQETEVEHAQFSELSAILDQKTEEVEQVEEAEEEEHVSSMSSPSPESFAPSSPVNPSRISVSAPLTSLFRDISPHT